MFTVCSAHRTGVYSIPYDPVVTTSQAGSHNNITTRDIFIRFITVINNNRRLKAADSD